MGTTVSGVKERISESAKHAKKGKWFEDRIDLLDSTTFDNYQGGFFGGETDGVSNFKKKQVNYDLFNNIVNLRDFEYVCKPYGSEVGELPANMTNRDIISAKVKAILGLEMKRPFSWKILAVNEEATTRKEQEEFGRIKQFVIESILAPIREQLEMQTAEQTKGRKLSADEQAQMQEQMAQQLEAMTPPEVKNYMMRKHQDPAEALASQILEYLIKKEDIPMKFNKGFKHAMISADEVYWIGILNGEPVVRVVNSLYFDYDNSPDNEYIEEGEWATYEMRMNPSEVVKYFGTELSDQDIDDIYAGYPYGAMPIADQQFNFSNDRDNEGYTIRVLHGVWKSLMKIGFLTYVDQESMELQEMLIDETYKFNSEAGDLAIEWQWIPFNYEAYKIGHDKYAFKRAVPGQSFDLDNLFHRPLPFVGASYDNLNSESTSMVDRMKAYQYYYNIIMYRIELLMASDKGKILMMNINSIPRSEGIDIEKWHYFVESSKVGWINPNEEGNRNIDVTNAAKVIDMSLASDIQRYINLAEYIERRCGDSVGVTKTVEGMTGPEEAVSNNRQNLVQASHILEPYFHVHNNIKRNVLQRLVDTAKIAYSENPKKYLSYVLDDFSTQMIALDQGLLANSTYGLFVSNSSESQLAKDTIQQLAHAAMQTQKADLSDVIKVIRSESVQQAEELLEVAEERKSKEAQSAEAAKIKAIDEAAAAQHKRENELIDKEYDRKEQLEKIKGQFDLDKQAMLSVGFNEDKDIDNDGKLDVLEIYEGNADIEMKERKLSLEEQKLQQSKKEHADKMKLEDKKLKKSSEKKK